MKTLRIKSFLQFVFVSWYLLQIPGTVSSYQLWAREGQTLTPLLSQSTGLLVELLPSAGAGWPGSLLGCDGTREGHSPGLAGACVLVPEAFPGILILSLPVISRLSAFQNCDVTCSSTFYVACRFCSTGIAGLMVCAIQRTRAYFKW